MNADILLDVTKNIYTPLLGDQTLFTPYFIHYT